MPSSKEKPMSPETTTYPYHSSYNTFPQEFDANYNSGFQELHQGFDLDLKGIATLQVEFDRTLKITNKDRLNYNPVLARWKFEQLKNDKDKQDFIKYELQQIFTALGERNSVSISSVNYLIGDDGEVYNELFPKEPFRRTLERGVACMQEYGSVELKRESAEVAGWIQIIETLKNPNTPINSKAIVISPPGNVEKSNYVHNFVDIYESLEDPITKKRIIKMTRNASNLNNYQYYDAVQELEPDYFNGINQPIDVWFLGKPIYKIPEIDPRTVEELVEQVFGIHNSTLSKEEMVIAWENTFTVAKHFVETAICADVFNPKDIATKWNAILVKNDLEIVKVKNRKEFQDIKTKIEYKQFNNIYDEVAWLSKQDVQTIAAACGASAGFNLGEKGGSILGGPDMLFLSNSVAQFGLDSDEFGSLKFKCPNKNCKKENIRPYGKLIEQCQHCGSTEVACKDEKATSITKKSDENAREVKKPERSFLFPNAQTQRKKKLA